MKLPLTVKPNLEAVTDDWLVLDVFRQLVARCEYESDARALVWAVNANGLRDALARCEVAMDSAATLGLAQQLPPAYRDSWAAGHTAARNALKESP